MDKITNRPEFNDSRPLGNTAKLTAVTSAGRNNPSIAANLSIALAQREKHVCLITTDTPSSNNPTLPDHCCGSPLEDLLVARKDFAEILLDGSSGTQILPAGSTFINFIQMDKIKQQQLVELLAELEAAFDYLIVEIPSAADKRLLNIYQAIPTILLSITPEAESLTSAFALLRTLKRQHPDQQVHVIVEMAENLPSAHDAFKKLKHAASKYLQIELHYLGYTPSGQLQDAAKDSPASSSRLTHHLESIADRYCALADLTTPLTSLSRHYRGLCSAQKRTEQSVETSSVPAIGKAEKTEPPTLGALQKPGDGNKNLSDIAGMHTAVHYASLLAQREVHL